MPLVFPIEIPKNREIGKNRANLQSPNKCAVKLHHLVESKVFSPAQRFQKWQQISETTLCSSSTIQSANFQRLSDADLFNLFDLTDGHFFNGLVGDHLAAHKHDLSFRVSRRMTSSGGITTTRLPVRRRGKMQFEIAISSTLLFESFRDDKKPINVTGMLCSTRLQALMRIMEHEMIHLVEMMLWQDSSCSKRRFKGIAFRLFGHRQSTHELLAPSDNAAKNLDIAIGDHVRFQRGKTCLAGFVNRITKRATVLVPDRKGVLYSDGNRYQKYYVPVSKLRKAS